MPASVSTTTQPKTPSAHSLSEERKNWLFVGSHQDGERAAVLMSLIESAKLNGHDAWAYFKDILPKLPTWPNSRLAELLPNRWVAPGKN
jgi:transposase